MKPIVMSLGGSVLVPDEIELPVIEKVIKLLSHMSTKYKIYVVIGGGRTARRYISAARKLGGNEFFLDKTGILATRMNASLLTASLPEAYPKIAESIEEAAIAGKTHDIVVMGGTEPGHTTDAVTALLAEKIGAKFMINASCVDGVYEEDPKKNPSAKKFDRIKYTELLGILQKGDFGAGPNIIFDILALKIVQRSKIKVYMLDGRDIENLEKALNDEDFEGTIVE